MFGCIFVSFIIILVGFPLYFEWLAVAWVEIEPPPNTKEILQKKWKMKRRDTQTQWVPFEEQFQKNPLSNQMPSNLRATRVFFAHRIFHHTKSSRINSTSMDHIPVEFYSQILNLVFYFRKLFFWHRLPTKSLHGFLCISITTMVRCEENPPKLMFSKIHFSKVKH